MDARSWFREARSLMPRRRPRFRDPARRSYPRNPRRSLPRSAHASTRRSSSPGPGTGISISTISLGCSRASASLAAFLLAPPRSTRAPIARSGSREVDPAGSIRWRNDRGIGCAHRRCPTLAGPDRLAPISAARGVGQRQTDPPNPPPVSRAPYAPWSTASSRDDPNSGVDTSKSVAKARTHTGEQKRPHRADLHQAVSRSRRTAGLSRSRCESPGRDAARRSLSSLSGPSRSSSRREA